MNKFFTLSIISLAIALSDTLSYADDITKKIKISEDSPINIKSEAMIILSQENISIFRKNVHVTQEDLSIFADEITVHSTYNEALRKNDFDKIIAVGNVKFSHKERSATSKKAVYDVKTQTVTLSDGVQLQEKNNNLKGSTFTYNLETGQSNLKGAVDKTNPNKPARVRATLTPGSNADNIFLPVPAIEMLTGGKKAKKQAEEKLGY